MYSVSYNSVLCSVEFLESFPPIPVSRSDRKRSARVQWTCGRSTEALRLPVGQGLKAWVQMYKHPPLEQGLAPAVLRGKLVGGTSIPGYVESQ